MMRAISERLAGRRTAGRRTAGRRTKLARAASFLAGVLAVSGALVWLGDLVGSGRLDADENRYYRLVTLAAQASPTASRSKAWRPAPEGLALEVSGLAPWTDGRLAVAIRKGEVWLLDNVYDDPPKNVTYHRYAAGLHEPLGLQAERGSLWVAQRSELTELRDTDGDDVADLYLNGGKGWGVSGNYHEYAYGPRRGPDGKWWLTLNIGMGRDLQGRPVKRQPKWRGWCVALDSRGNLEPICAGMRSPAGIGANARGDLFATDQQGNWIGTCSLLHLRRGAFFGHPECLAAAEPAALAGDPGQPGHALKALKALVAAGEIPSGLSWPEALRKIPQLTPPAVWFPYKKAGQSATDVLCDQTGGKFGPFQGQLFIGEFRLAAILRVFLEQVDGQYQGACFPFREGLASAVIRMEYGTDGSMFVGLSNRGWSSLGEASYGLQRLVWTGEVPFEIKEMKALPDGFELVFTKPVRAESAGNLDGYAMKSYTYLLQQPYGSPEVGTREVAIRAAELSPDRLRVRLRCDGLRAGFVHELLATGVRSAEDGLPLLHNSAFYTLNAIPQGR